MLGLDEVRDFVKKTLCSRDNLEVGAFAISETPVHRGSAVCGVYFCLHGPRLLRLTAIWDRETGVVLCYGPRGERFLTARLNNPATAA
ncbi:MAG: hypothetical protein AAGJ46_01610 [Planctomycetota bacterium]